MIPRERTIRLKIVATDSTCGTCEHMRGRAGLLRTCAVFRSHCFLTGAGRGFKRWPECLEAERHA